MPADSHPSDPELTALIEALLDRRISEDDARRLADRLRTDPEAMAYCAEMVRFDATMQDELRPQRIEWTDTRRLILSKGNGSPELEIERNQTVRVGGVGAGPSEVVSGFDTHGTKLGRGRFWATLLAVFLLVVVAFVFSHRGDKPPSPEQPSLRLLNGDFEATNLTYLSDPTNPALVDWQDYFVTENAVVAEIGRVTNGRVLPKSGRNVARLTNFAYLTQRLRKSDTSPLLAEPGMKLAVTGWAYVLAEPSDGDRDEMKIGVPELSLRGSIRFVAGGSPGMLQYELAEASVSLQPGDWQPVLLEFTLPMDLRLAPAYGDSKATLDIKGKELTLSLDSQCDHGFQLLLDDLAIREVP